MENPIIAVYLNSNEAEDIIPYVIILTTAIYHNYFA